MVETSWKRKLFWSALNLVDLVRSVRLRFSGISKKDSIIIIGSPRSGTTWLMNIIARLPRYSSICEPLHPRWFTDVREVGLKDRPYLDQEDNHKRKKELLDKILSGYKASKEPRWDPPVKSNLTKSIKQMISRIRSDRLVIKFTRANRMVLWLYKSFPSYKYIYIIRNPFAVINSQIRNKISGYVTSKTGLFDYLKDESLNDELVDIITRESRQIVGDKMTDNIEQTVSTLAGYLSLSWCLDNIIPISLYNNNNFTTLQYEHLTKEPLNSIDSVFCDNDLYLDRQKLSSILKGKMKPKKLNEQRNKWRLNLSKREISDIQSVISITNIYSKLGKYDLHF